MKKVLYFCTYEETIPLLNEKLNNEAKKNDFIIDFNSYNKIKIYLPNEGKPLLYVNGVEIEEYSFIYFLGWGKSPEIACSISRILKQRGISFADKSTYGNTYGGKILDMTMAKENEISIPDTIYLSKELLKDSYEEIKLALGPVFVLKENWGRKGEQVWLIKSKEKFQEILKSETNGIFIFQKFIPNNFDYRIVTFNYEVKASFKRIRGANEEFRNNVAIGATRENIDIKSLENDVIEMSEKISRVASREVAGIDIIKSIENNKYYFIELNAPPGVSDNPLALSEMMKYIKKHF